METAPERVTARPTARPALGRRRRALVWLAVLSGVSLLHGVLLGGASLALARTPVEPVLPQAATAAVVVARVDVATPPSTPSLPGPAAPPEPAPAVEAPAAPAPKVVKPPAAPAPQLRPEPRRIADHPPTAARSMPERLPAEARPSTHQPEAAATEPELGRAEASWDPAPTLALAQAEPPRLVPAVLAPMAKGEPEALAPTATPEAPPASGPSSPSSPAASSPVPTRLPTYRTRIPGAALVNYRLSRGGIYGSGELEWKPEGNGYTARLEGRVPIIGTLITQISRGRFDAAGLAPERFTDKRLRRNETAANFQRNDGVISFSGQQPEVPITPGVQDRVSVMVQLAAIAAGWSRPPPAGEHYLIRVVGARGDAQVWTVRFEGPQTLRTPEGTVAALHFQRESKEPNDTRAEFWLDPARQFLPVRVLLADGNGEALELMRQP